MIQFPCECLAGDIADLSKCTLLSEINLQACYGISGKEWFLTSLS